MADDLAYQLRKCGKQIGIKVKKPAFIDFNPKNRKLKVGKVIRNFVRNNKRLPQFVLIVIGEKESKLYKEIKEVACK